MFQACGPLWSYECGSSYYSTGICSKVNAAFKFSGTVKPAFQSKLEKICTVVKNQLTTQRRIIYLYMYVYIQ